jgi:hypothetical protein
MANLKKDEAVSALYRIGGMLRVKEMSDGQAQINNTMVRLGEVLDAESDFHDIADQLNDAAQALNLKDIPYYERCIANAFKVLIKRRERAEKGGN